MSKWIIILGAWIISLWLPAIQAAEDNLFFSGALVNEPCVLADGDRLIEMDFKSVFKKDFYINTRTKSRYIELHLQNCDVDVGKRMVSITFSGNESRELPGFLSLRSATVRGIVVGLETMSGVALHLHQPHRLWELSPGDNVLSFNAFLQGEPTALANHTLGQGDFEASLTFALNYE
jgi:type 1 fimbria pilin